MVEPDRCQAAEGAGGRVDLEAHDLATGSHRASHLGETLAVVGEVAHAVGDGGGVEGIVRHGQVEGVPPLEAQTLQLGRALLVGDADHARAEVDAQRGAARLRGPIEIGRDLARATGDVECPATGPDLAGLHDALAPARLLEAADGEVHAVVDAGDAVEHLLHLLGWCAVALAHPRKSSTASATRSGRSTGAM